MTMHIMIHGRAGSTVAPAWGRSHVKQLKRPQPCGESRMQNMTKSTAGKVRATDSRDRVQLFVQYQPHREPTSDASGAAASVIVQTLIGHTAETVQTRGRTLPFVQHYIHTTRGSWQCFSNTLPPGGA